WSLIVAILIFALGGGMSIYEGLNHLKHPEHMHKAIWNYVVLAIALVFEGASFYFALRAFRQEMGNQSTLQTIHTSKDPTTFTVLFEDASAIFGLLVAFVGIALGDLLNNPYMDGVASVIIGIILGVVAVFLAYESRSLLIGEGVTPETLASIREIACTDPAVA